MDTTLEEMARSYADAILAYCAKRQMPLADVCWDAPLDMNAHPVPFNVIELLSASHAIGVFCGIAAGLDVTPNELLWNLGYDTDAIDATAVAKVPALPAPVSDRRRRKRSHAATINAKSRRTP